MGLEYGELATQESLTANATSHKFDIDVNYTLNDISMSFFCLKLAATATTNQILIDKVDRVEVSTVNGDPESSIDGDDLWDFSKYAFGNSHNYISKLTSTDNLPHAFGMQYPFSPHPHNLRAPFGLAPRMGKQFTVKNIADVAATFDAYTMDLLLEGVSGSDAGTSGHMKFTRDAYTSGAVDANQDTQVIGKRLLGTYNFMTTSHDDLAASASHDVTGIRSQRLLEDTTSVLKWKPFSQWGRRKNATNTDLGVIAGDVTDIPDILDDGRWFQDFGIQSLPAGINMDSGKKYEIRTTAGVAEATRVYGVLLA